MDQHARQTALRMIPYGLYILTAENEDGETGAASVSWVTQASFEPPLVAIGVKADSRIHEVIKESGTFALNVLDKSQGPVAFTFFKPARKEGQKIAGEPYHPGKKGAPLLDNAAAHIECCLIDTVEKGDHSVFVGEVVDADVRKAPDGRPDDVTLWLKDLGDKVFYGG